MQLAHTPIPDRVGALNGVLSSTGKIILFFDRQFSTASLCVGLSVLLLLMLAPVSWTGNEENYFQLAYRAVAPEQFTQFHAAFDQSRARIVPEYLLGSLVKWLGYEHAQVVARIGMAFLYAFAIAVFFNAAGIGLLDALLIVCIFNFVGEDLIGGEWLFHGVESKTLAYAALFVAFGLVSRDRWYPAIVAGAIATYMHFLVGGFWSGVLLFLYCYRASGGAIRPRIARAATYALLVSPLLALIVLDQLLSKASGQSSDGLTANVIYSQIRNPHHVAPFDALWHIWSWAPGIILTGCLLFVLSLQEQHRRLPLFGLAAIIGLLFIFLALTISFFDRNTYFFGKFYLFRPSTLTLFFSIATITAALKAGIGEDIRLLWASVACTVVICFAWSQFQQQIDTIRKAPVLPFKESLLSAIHANSAPGEIVLIEPYEDKKADFIRLHRDIDRPTLVSWKFVPTNTPDILRWYALIQSRKQLFNEGCDSSQLKDLPIRLLVVFHQATAEKVQDCGPVVWQDGEAALIRVNR